MSQIGGWNPFQNEPLRVPLDYEWLKNLTKAAGGDAESRKVGETDLAPFNRLVDGWLVAVALGARHREAGEQYAPPEHRFEYGARLHGDDRAIHFLHHVALAELLDSGEFQGRDEEAAYELIENPSRVMAICNDLAARGFPVLRSMTEAATLPPLAELLRGLNDELGDEEDEAPPNDD